MAVLIHGDTESDNYQFALNLRPALEHLVGPENDAHIIVSAFTPGCQVQDTDLVVMGICTNPVGVPIDFMPSDLQSRPARLASFALAIEVKSHPPEAIKFEGNQVLVRYINKASRAEEWHGATDQNRKQVYSLKEYLERERLQSPFWTATIWLRNVATSDLPKTANNLLGGDVSSRDLLKLIVDNRLSDLRWQSTKPWASSYVRCTYGGANEEMEKAIAVFTKKLKPSSLDRSKMERITKRTVEPEMPEYIAKMGTQLLIFRGRGGSGKTMRLLQLANRLRVDREARILFLTYNRALACDLRRLIHLIGITDSLHEPTVAIRTSEKFFWDLMVAFGEAPTLVEGAPFPQAEFESRKLVLKELFSGETQASLQEGNTWKSYPSLFNWDFVFVDEAQDWPTPERDILHSLFGAQRLVVADGVDQLVRRDGRCDWTELALAKHRQIVTLRKALRLKSNLCAFVEAFVSLARLEWDMAVNNEVLGGSVLVVVGDYNASVHHRIMAKHKAAGNEPIDALFCVTGSAGSFGSQIAQFLRSSGEDVWDGSIESNRDTIPERLTQLRIVKYESCRGLEGWTVVCLDLDRFLERQRVEGMQVDRQLFETQEEVAERFSARWGMIPMTRAIDTLVLHVNRRSHAAALLKELAKGREYIEIIET